MNKRDSMIQWVAGLLVVACLLASGPIATALTAEAGRAQLVYTDEAQEGDPPEVALGIALGAFRGLFVNYLWLRANRLKEEGKFYEAIELSSVITRLQPRFPRVWAFHAWNMAYNISVATYSAEERWQWVRAGVNLLRDEAIPRNPNDVLLHKELAWIFVHKIQGWSDDAHFYYKREMAREWSEVLGPPPVREQGVEPKQQMLDWFRPIVEAPSTLDRVVRHELEALDEASPVPLQPDQRISTVQQLVDQLEAAGAVLDLELLAMVARHQVFKNSWYSEADIIELRGNPLQVRVAELVDDPTYADAWSRLLPFLRRRALIDDYHMEPERMYQYIERYGPLDWRHPASHAIYWSARGVEEGLDRKSTTFFSTLNTDRVTVAAVQELFRFGDITYDLITNEYYALPDLEFADTYGLIIEELIERGGPTQDAERTYRTYMAGYMNFLREVVRVYYQRGDVEEAYGRYTYAQEYYARHGNRNDPGEFYEWQLPLDEFVMKQLRERLTIPHVAVSEFQAAIQEGLLRGLLRGGRRGNLLYESQMQYARDIYDYYTREQGIETITDAETRGRMRSFFEDTFELTVAKMIGNMLTGSQLYSGARLGPFQRAELFRKLPVTLQRAVYDDVAAAMIQQGGMDPRRFAGLFPEPAGMAEYRAMREAQEAQGRIGEQREVEFEKQ